MYVFLRATLLLNIEYSVDRHQCTFMWNGTDDSDAVRVIDYSGPETPLGDSLPLGTYVSILQAVIHPHFPFPSSMELVWSMALSMYFTTVMNSSFVQLQSWLPMKTSVCPSIHHTNSY